MGLPWVLLDRADARTTGVRPQGTPLGRHLSRRKGLTWPQRALGLCLQQDCAYNACGCTRADDAALSGLRELYRVSTHFAQLPPAVRISMLTSWRRNPMLCVPRSGTSPDYRAGQAFHR